MTAPPSFLVWFDLGCEEFLAVEKDAATPALRAELAREGADVREVQAATRRDAVKAAFPDRSVAGKPVTEASPGRAPSALRRH